MRSAAGVRRATKSDASAMAALHTASIAEGFLVVLGQPFLERLYRRVSTGAHSFAFVGEDDGNEVAGFVAVAEDTRRLYREFIAHDGLGAGLRAAPALLRHPKKVYETLRYGVNADTTAEGAEVLATAVGAAWRGRGLGAALVNAATAELRARGIEHAHVVTAADNLPALRTYTRCGFRRAATVEVHRGVEQDVLVWP